MTCEFTHKHYLDTVDEHKKVGTQLLMRHDVDFSLEKAEKLAVLEAVNGIHSFYFVLFGGSFYSPLTLRNHIRLISLTTLHHRVGLHYQIDITETDAWNLKYMIHEAQMLQHILQEPVTICSQHDVVKSGRPSQEFFQKLEKIPLRDINTYLKDYKYLSDSGMNWREGCFCKHVGKYDKLMVLTHPIWWNDRPISRTMCISNWYNHENFKRQNVYKQYMENLKSYDKRIQRN
ncbi:MAG: hypothetical protein ACE5H1_06840 [Thermodesulfobacteriota bacterium]